VIIHISHARSTGAYLKSRNEFGASLKAACVYIKIRKMDHNRANCASVHLYRWCGVMVARDVVEILADIHADPFQSGFDSQHRQDCLGLKM
jgi:hypothetical protein